MMENQQFIITLKMTMRLFFVKTVVLMKNLMNVICFRFAILPEPACVHMKVGDMMRIRNNPETSNLEL